MTKRVGIIGGIGPSSTIEYYSRIIKKYQKKYDDLNYPEIVIYSLSHAKLKEYEDCRNTYKYIEYIMQGVNALASLKIDFLAFAAISPHSVIDDIRRITNFPIISAVDSAFIESKKLCFSRLLLIGIKYTMQSSFFQDRFISGGIEVIVPTPEDQDKIHSIIYNELVNGTIKDSTRQSLFQIIKGYDVEGVLLGCMRLPVILTNKHSRIKFIDMLDLHTTDIVQAAIEDFDSSELAT